MRLLDRYEEVVGHQEVERLRQLAAQLQGKRIVHVNSTRTGGGSSIYRRTWSSCTIPNQFTCQS
jgi:hypothetical protein